MRRVPIKLIFLRNQNNQSNPGPIFLHSGPNLRCYFWFSTWPLQHFEFAALLLEFNLF